MLKGDGVIQLGNLYPQRDFTFVDDTVSGFLAAAASGSLAGQVVHIGSGSAVSVSKLADLVSRLTGRTFALKRDDARVRPPASEVDRLICDNRKLRLNTAWQPLVTLEEGLRRTIEWLEPRLDMVRAEEYSI
jgi:dTDP-glucose 4,6-dehydratase